MKQGGIVIENDNESKFAIPMIYTNGNWQPTIPYVYRNSTWNKAGTAGEPILSWLDSNGNYIVDSNGNYIGVRKI